MAAHLNPGDRVSWWVDAASVTGIAALFVSAFLVGLPYIVLKMFGLL